MGLSESDIYLTKFGVEIEIGQPRLSLSWKHFPKNPRCYRPADQSSLAWVFHAMTLQPIDGNIEV